MRYYMHQKPSLWVFLMNGQSLNSALCTAANCRRYCLALVIDLIFPRQLINMDDAISITDHDCRVYII